MEGARVETAGVKGERTTYNSAPLGRACGSYENAGLERLDFVIEISDGFIFDIWRNLNALIEIEIHRHIRRPTGHQIGGGSSRGLAWLARIAPGKLP